jgi:hypothetical protein
VIVFAVQRSGYILSYLLRSWISCQTESPLSLIRLQFWLIYPWTTGIWTSSSGETLAYASAAEKSSPTSHASSTETLPRSPHASATENSTGWAGCTNCCSHSLPELMHFPDSLITGYLPFFSWLFCFVWPFALWVSCWFSSPGRSLPADGCPAWSAKCRQEEARACSDPTRRPQE